MTDETVIGAGQIGHLTWKQRLDLISCTECGRCQDQCPAWATGKPLSPKLLITDLRDHLFAAGPELLSAGPGNGDGGGLAATALVPDVIEPDVVWSCTTCGACVEQCPVDIEHVDTIMDMRRYQVMMEARSRLRPGGCCATSRTRATRGGSVAATVWSGPTASTSKCRW